jgi:hypothetical protein
MKEPNYTNLRELLSNNSGGKVLNIIRDNQEHLEMEPRVFDLVFESFWDLYTLKSSIPELNVKKLLTWINKIKLIVNHSSGGSGNVLPQQNANAEDDAEEGKVEETHR